VLDILDALPDYVMGFEPFEIDDVVTNYVCPVCHGQLTAFDVPMERIYIIVCPEHGNVEQIGRVRRESVNSEMERARRQFDIVINNLPEFWGELKRPKYTEAENMKTLGF
jgi:hypothetical protein